MSDRITDLLHEVADDVEPGDRLDAIRAEIGVRRPRRGWWAAGGAGLVAASVVAALVLSTGSPPSSSPGPVGQASTQSPTPDGTGSLQERKDRLEEMRRAAEAENGASTTAVAVYYVGDTPDGPRLYREFRRLEGEPLDAAVSAATGYSVDGPPLAPADPDYRVPWPVMTRASAALSAKGDVIEVTLGGDPQDDLRDRGNLSEVEAELAVEQLIRTAQGAIGERLPVRFLVFDDITDQVLGVPTSGPLTARSDLAVLSPVSLTEPREGLRVDNDESLTVRGTTFAADGLVTTRIQRWEGTFVAAERVDRVGLGNEGAVSFTATFTLGELPPGDYVVISEVTDLSGSLTTDTRRIIVVD